MGLLVQTTADSQELATMIYKPQALVLKMKGDPEQLVRDWETYISRFKAFLLITERISHSNLEMAGMSCDRCRVSKSLLTLVGGTEVAHSVTGKGSRNRQLGGSTRKDFKGNHEPD